MLMLMLMLMLLLRTLPSSLLTALLGGLLAGCVTVHIQPRDGSEVRTVRHLGVLHVELSNPAQAISGSLSGVGLVGAPLGWSLGYTRQRWALMGRECKVVAWLSPDGVDAQTRGELVRAAGVCLVEDEAGSTPPSSGSRS